MTARVTRYGALAMWKLYAKIRLKVPSVRTIVHEQLIVYESNLRTVLLVGLGGEPRKLSFLQRFLRVVTRYTYIVAL